MFNDFYALSFNPFDKHHLKEKDCFDSTDHKEMMARLDYLKDTRGVGVFTARPGMGKSLALKCFAKSLNPSLYQMEYICLSTISISEFYKQLCTSLGTDTSGGKASMFKSIQDKIYYMYKDRKKPLILAIDEAQYLNTSILRDLKMIFNQDYDSVNCFTLILTGEVYLNTTLEKPIHEALRQRVSVHYNFTGLSDVEVADYIKHKVTIAGGATSIFDKAAISAIHSHSDGNPRIIDNIATDALTLGEQMQKHTIDADVIMAAINEQALC